MATYELKIGTSVVLSDVPGARPHPPAGFSGVTIKSLTRSYQQPSSLVIHMLGSWRQFPYAADTPVTLKRGNTVVFEGLLDLPRPLAGAGSFPIVEYTAYDRRRMLSGPEASALPPTFPGAPTPERLVYFKLAGKTLGEMVDKLLTYIGDDLSARGVATTVAYKNSADSTAVFSPVSISVESIDSAFAKLAAAAPGVQLFMDPNATGLKPKYTFVHVFRSQIYDLALDEPTLRHERFEMRPSLEGRCGAVKTLAGSSQGSATVTLPHQASPQKAWNPADEANWSVAKGSWAVDQTGQPTALTDVFRKFTIPNGVKSNVVLQAWVESYHEDEGESGDTIVYTPADVALIDWDKKVFWLASPAVKPIKGNANWVRAGRYNPNEPGRCKAADVLVRFGEDQSGTFPVYSKSYRYPSSGFGGKAYQQAKLSCGYEKTIGTKEGMNPADYARAAWEALSEPLWDGTIPVFGELPEDLLFLDRRINVVTLSHGTTGFERLEAPLIGFEMTFEGGPQTILQFSRNTGLLLPGGAA